VTGPAPRSPRRASQIVILLGIAVMVGVAVIAKDQLAGPTSPTGSAAALEAPQIALDRALAANAPTLAFYHSLTCDSCVEMTAIVEEVYPEFEGTITLVDVDVYDGRNQALVERSRIVAIPTVVLIDRTGQAQPFPGVMKAEQLRERLRALAGGG
jgi:hypothetical protein